jgi:hypothetical protein
MIFSKSGLFIFCSSGNINLVNLQLHGICTSVRRGAFFSPECFYPLVGANNICPLLNREKGEYYSPLRYSSSFTENDDPHPEVVSGLGFWIINCTFDTLFLSSCRGK